MCWLVHLHMTCSDQTCPCCFAKLKQALSAVFRQCRYIDIDLIDKAHVEAVERIPVRANGGMFGVICPICFTGEVIDENEWRLLALQAGCNDGFVASHLDSPRQYAIHLQWPGMRCLAILPTSLI